MAEDERKGGGGKGEEEDAGTAPDTPVITVFGLTVEPNMCPVQDALKLEVEFKSDREITGAKWEVTYTVDSTRKRHIIHLGESKAADYTEGANSFSFEVERINVSGIKPSRLTNVGLLSATMTQAGPDGGRQHVIDVNLVVQVSEEGGKYIRCIYNPLD